VNDAVATEAPHQHDARFKTCCYRSRGKRSFIAPHGVPVNNQYSMLLGAALSLDVTGLQSFGGKRRFDLVARRRP
jgi:hypothetical protein